MVDMEEVQGWLATDPGISLIRREPVAVRFSGQRSAEGPMTLGQLNVLEWFEGTADLFDAYARRPLDLPPGAGLDDVAGALAVLLTRHEALRTTYRAGDHRVQVVAGSGELLLEVYSIGGPPPGDGALPAGTGAPRLDARQREALTTAFVDLLRTQPPIPSADLPLRVAVIVHAGTVVAGVLLCSHLCVDLRAAELVAEEFADLVRGRPLRTGGALPYQPLDRAAVECGPAFRRRVAAALGRWEQRLLRMPQCLYACPRTGTESGSGAALMTSRAAALALRHLTTRTGASPQVIVLAAFSALLAQRTGYRRCEFVMIAANRSEPRLADYVGTTAQATVVSIDTEVGGFDELVQRALFAAISAERDGVYDVFDRATLVRRVQRRRGVHLRFEPLFNSAVGAGPGTRDALPALDEVMAAQAGTELRWEPMMPMWTLLRFDLWGIDEALHCRLWSGDTGRVPRADLESILLAIERLLVAAAHADLDRVAVRGALGLDAIARGPGWLLVDSCWVELSEVQRLVVDAAAPAVGRVFAEVDGNPLVAFIAGGAATGLAPRDIHERCVAALPGRPTAMAPRWYVVCDAPPDELDQLDAWRRQRVVAEGAGRSGQV